MTEVNDTNTEIMFFQSTAIGTSDNEAGLFELFLSHFNTLEGLSIFDKVQVIVPNHAMSAFMKDNVAKKLGICANLDFVVLPGPVIENIYKANNPDIILFDFKEAKYIIYDYLCNNKLSSEDSIELNQYIYQNDKLDIYRVYQLASQLQQIFHEYLYLRTFELLNLEKSKFPGWQKEILAYLFKHIDSKKTFLDIYTYFTTTDISKLQLPNRLFIFGLTSIYPSQLNILKYLAKSIDIYWYYQPCSYEYYGDLLSDATRNKLEKKLLNEPDLNLDDLYLTSGNPLLSNLGSQSREFIELLQANDITVYDFKPATSIPKMDTMLDVIQNDIRSLKYRITLDKRIHQSYYEDPIAVSNHNIKINSCHNRMREVQVMFNEIVGILNNDNKLNDILVVASDIDLYAPYISAVFDNEVLSHNQKLPYNITGNRQHSDYKILETIKLIINTPYILNVSYFIDILNQIGVSEDDINWIKKSLLENATHFGYSSDDYNKYGYQNYPIHSFLQFINNISLGACLNNSMFESKAPIYNSNDGKYIPYDNIDSNQLELCEKIISLFNLLSELRQVFYSDENTLRKLTIKESHDTLTNIVNSVFEINLTTQNFLGILLEINLKTPIDLQIINQIIDEYCKASSNKINLDGRITCASLGYLRNIPYKYIYILGLNFGEFPSSNTPNQLSILAKTWHLADRNYNIEDKQIFLDTILAARKMLYLSYIGRAETDNSEIKPSPVLGLLINTIEQSFTNIDEIITTHSLHPFYNNSQNNYSQLWHKVGSQINNNFEDRRWDFTNLTKLQQMEIEVKIDSIVNTFLYTNSNLYKTLGISTYNEEIELEDTENLVLFNRSIAGKIYRVFETYKPNSDQLYEYLSIKGIIGYQHFGEAQYKYYKTLYDFYKKHRGNEAVEVDFTHTITRNDEKYNLLINGTLYIENNSLILIPDFGDINYKPLADKFSDLPYKLKLTAMVYAALIASRLDKILVVRQINSSLETSDLVININQDNMINQILVYYLRSLNNPVLIHRAAIAEYANTLSISKAYNKYSGSFNNFDLENIRQDIIFGSIANKYFDVIKDVGSINDIVNIGELLSKMGSI